MRSAAIAQAITLHRVKNANGWASTWSARWITPGLVNYQDVRAGVGYVSKEAIDRSMQTMVGRPLVIKHEPISDVTGLPVDPVRPDNMEEVASGYISRVWWADDGWAWCEGTCHDDEAKGLARPSAKGGRGWRVSCCYSAVGAVGPAGKLNGMPYDFEIRQFNGEHLALHPNPRYEGATIIMNATTAKPSTAMFKLFGTKKTEPTAADIAAKKAADDAAAAEATRLANAKTDLTPTEIGADTVVEIAEGVTVTIGELAASHTTLQAQLKNGMEMDPEMEVEYANGRRAKMSRLCQAMVDHDKMEEDKKNAMDLEDENKKRIAAATTTGTSGLSFAKNGLDGKPVEPAKPGHFLRLVNAATTNSDKLLLKNAGKTPETQQSRIERGKSRWGAPPKMAGLSKN